MKIVITKANRWTYFQWFVLGLYEADREKRIKLSIRLGLWDMIMFYLERTFLGRAMKHFFRNEKIDSYHLDGYAILDDNTKKHFTIDSSDTPYMFDLKRLKSKDIYFKMQYPICINDSAFHLTDEIDIPWIDSEDKDSLYLRGTDYKRKTIEDFDNYRSKIFPLMSPTRQIAKGNTYKELRQGFENYSKDYTREKTKVAMCYFGNAFGPKPTENIIYPDFGWEADIEGYFGDKVSHPNEKRAVMAKFLQKMGPGYDARIICDTFADSRGNKKTELIIPIERFCEHIAQFQYNYNVSGYAMSIPSRFIESFVVGTAIVTDKLAVKWYADFEDGVVETIEMGYLPKNKVNWDQFEKDLKSLKRPDPEKIRKAFDEKWSPKAVANYIIETIKKS